MLRNGENSTRYWHIRHNFSYPEERTLHSPIQRQRLEMAGLILFCVLLLLSVSSYGRRLNANAHSAAQLDDMNYFVRVQNGKFVVGPSCKPFYISGKKRSAI
jgi:hypothetical protein